MGYETGYSMRFTTRLLGYTILLTLLCFTTDILYGQFARAWQGSGDPLDGRALSDDQQAELDETRGYLLGAIESLELDDTTLPSDFVGGLKMPQQRAFFSHVWQKINDLGFVKRSAIKAMMSLDYCAEFFDESPLSCADRALLRFIDDNVESVPQIHVRDNGSFTLVAQDRPLEFYAGYDDKNHVSLKLKGAGVIAGLQSVASSDEQFAELLTTSDEKITEAFNTVSHSFVSFLGGSEAQAIGLINLLLMAVIALLIGAVVYTVKETIQQERMGLLRILGIRYLEQQNWDNGGRSIVPALRKCEAMIESSWGAKYDADDVGLVLDRLREVELHCSNGLLRITENQQKTLRGLVRYFEKMDQENHYVPSFTGGAPGN